MSKKILTACAGLILLVSGLALADVPCSTTTTVVATGNGPGAPNAALCPGGDLDIVTVTVTVKDCDGTPLPGWMVAVDLEVVSGYIYICWDEATSKSAGPTDALGVATAEFRKFGGCGEWQFSAGVGDITAGPSNTIYVSSPDNIWATGDPYPQVDLVDFGNFAIAYQGTDPCYNYDSTGKVNLIDFGIFARHYIHECALP